MRCLSGSGAQSRAYSRPGYPPWLKLRSEDWAVYEMCEDIQRKREAAWERNAADRDRAMRIWKQTAARQADPAPQLAGQRFALAAGAWWQKPRPMVIV